MFLVNNNASIERTNAVHALERTTFWTCPECRDRFDDQEEAIEHHIEKHQEDSTEKGAEDDV